MSSSAVYLQPQNTTATLSANLVIMGLYSHLFLLPCHSFFSFSFLLIPAFLSFIFSSSSSLKCSCPQTSATLTWHMATVTPDPRPRTLSTGVCCWAVVFGWW